MPLESSPFDFFFTLFPDIINTKCLPQKLQVELRCHSNQGLKVVTPFKNMKFPLNSTSKQGVPHSTQLVYHTKLRLHFVALTKSSSYQRHFSWSNHNSQTDVTMALQKSQKK
jgi:hypothetical protein